MLQLDTLFFLKQEEKASQAQPVARVFRAAPATSADNLANQALQSVAQPMVQPSSSQGVSIPQGGNQPVNTNMNMGGVQNGGKQQTSNQPAQSSWNINYR